VREESRLGLHPVRFTYLLVALAFFDVTFALSSLRTLLRTFIRDGSCGFRSAKERARLIDSLKQHDRLAAGCERLGKALLRLHNRRMVFPFLDQDDLQAN